MIDVPLRTKKILSDAKELEKQEFYLAAILLYVQYLEHMMLVAVIQYWEYHDPANIYHKLNKIFQIKDDAQLDFGKILSLIPNRILDKKTKQTCKCIQNIRNTMAAHSFFIVSLDKKDKKRHVVKDVNNYKKIIRRLYKLIRHEHRIANVEQFLDRHPFANCRTIEEDAYRVEKTILKKICQDTQKKVLDASNQMSALLPPFGKFVSLDEFS